MGYESELALTKNELIMAQAFGIQPRDAIAAKKGGLSVPDLVNMVACTSDLPVHVEQGAWRKLSPDETLPQINHYLQRGEGFFVPVRLYPMGSLNPLAQGVETNIDDTWQSQTSS